jgi:zinc protease
MKHMMVLILALVFAGSAMAEVKIKQVTSPGGLTAWLVEDHSIPFTALELRFRGGTSLDAPGKRGSINLMTALIEEGAGDLEARAYARTVEGLAASFGFGSTSDSVSVSARFLSENRAAALSLLRDTLHNPRFDQSAIDRVRGQVISGLRSNAKDPDEIAAATFRRLAFGDHPYGSDGSGTIETISGLSRDDIIAANRAVFSREHLYIGAVGDITAQELGALIDDLLGDLPATGATIPGPATVGLTGGVTVVDFDTPQSVALFGHAGIDQDDPDFFAAYVLNQVLGGGSFESRLMNEVREKRGLTYGVYSYLSPRDLAATYRGGVSSANGKIAETIAVISDEWAKAAHDGITQAEVDAAKTYLTGAYPLRFDGNARIAGILVSMQMQDLPIDYITTRNARVEAVTLADVNRVASELLQPEGLRFVVVGKPEGLQVSAD